MHLNSQKTCGPDTYSAKKILATNLFMQPIKPTEFVANMRARHIHNDPRKSIGKGTAREKGINRSFTRGPPDSHEKKTRERGRGQRV